MQRPSVTALTYSFDVHATRYNAISGIQPPRLEGIANIYNMVRGAVDNWGTINKAAPAKILFLRDGLSEGELQTVVVHEVGEIRREFSVTSFLSSDVLKTPFS